MDLSHWIAIAGIIIAVAVHSAVISSKISRFMGMTEEYMRHTNKRIDQMQDTHDTCYVRERLRILEGKQGEMPERLARIEQEIKGLQDKIDDLKQETLNAQIRRRRSDTPIIP